ncbi:MAG: hypothetical protein ACRCY5_03370 [Phocaeicola sp.]
MIPQADLPDLSEEARAIVVSEGQFMYGTASLTRLSVLGSVENDIFRRINGKPIGDVAQSMTRIGNCYYVPLNNSRKVEVFDVDNYQSVETMSINLNTIPMYIAHLGGDSIAVTDQTSKNSRLMIMDINHGKARDPLRRTISLEGRSFQTRLIGNKLWVGGDRLWVFDRGNLNEKGKRILTYQDGRVIQTIDFSKIVVDKNNLVWVLGCYVDPTTYSNRTFLLCIDPETEKTVKEIDLTALKLNSWVSCIDISPDLSTIYFNAARKIYAFDVDANAAPTKPQIEIKRETSRTVYNMQVSKENTIFLCEVTYGSLSRGDIFEHDSQTGEELQSFKAGIFPHFIYFK